MIDKEEMYAFVKDVMSLEQAQEVVWAYIDDYAESIKWKLLNFRILLRLYDKTQTQRGLSVSYDKQKLSKNEYKAK